MSQPSLTLLNCAEFVDLSKLLHGFFKIDTFLFVVTWICQCCYMYLLELFHGFIKFVPCISHPLPKKTKLKFDQGFKACWSFCFELKVLNCYITSFRISQCNVVLQISEGDPLTWVKISEGDSLTANQGSSSCVKSVVLISNLQKGNAHYPLTGWRIAILTICCFCSSKGFHFFIFFSEFSGLENPIKKNFKRRR